MQASDLVTEEDVQRAWNAAANATGLPMRAALEAVALDFYERGLREAADMVNAHAYDEDDCEISEISWLAKAILSKLRSAT